MVVGSVAGRGRVGQGGLLALVQSIEQRGKRGQLLGDLGNEISILENGLCFYVLKRGHCPGWRVTQQGGAAAAPAAAEAAAACYLRAEVRSFGNRS